MVRLRGGAFRMGSDEKPLLEQFPTAGAGLKAMLRAETPAMDITLSPYWIDRYEITNAQFHRFTQARPEWRQDRVGGNYLHHWSGGEPLAGRKDFPVIFVTWNAAMAYAKWAGKRLPTEAEWEFAAKGGRDTRYPWGNQDPRPDLVNYRESGAHAPVRVGSYPPNPYGLCDLSGNVWEFCLDPWQPYAGGKRPQTPADVRRMQAGAAERRVIRGGSYDGGAFNLRVTARDSHPANNPVAFVGFRCACSA